MRKELREWRQQGKFEAVVTRGLQREILEVTNLAQADYDEDEWTLMGTGNTLVGGEEYKEPLEQHYRKLRAAAFKAYYTNPHAKSIVRNLVNFVLGKGAQLSIQSEASDNEIQKARDEWEFFERKVRWRRKQKEIATRAFRDGETFIRYKVADKKGPTRMYFIEPDWVNSNDPKITHGIETDPKDVGVIKSYRIIKPENLGKNEEDTVPSELMQHIKLNVDENVKRGRTELEPVLSDLSEAQTFRRYRTILNKARTAVVMVRKMAGAGSQIQAQIDAQKPTKNTSTRGNKRQKAPKAGTVYTIDSESDIEFVSPNLGASDAAKDGRMILLAIAAGVILPEFVLTGDASNSNFASTKQAIITLIKNVEELQAFFAEEFEEIFERVIIDGKKQGRIPQGLEVKGKFEFPTFDIREFLTDVQGYNLLRQMGVVSKSSTAARFGFNYGEEVMEMEKDAKLDFSFTQSFLNNQGDDEGDEEDDEEDNEDETETE